MCLKKVVFRSVSTAIIKNSQINDYWESKPGYRNSLANKQYPICVLQAIPLPAFPRICHWFHAKEPIIYELLDLYHSCLVAGVGIAFKQQELDAAAAPGYCVIRPKSASSLPAQPRCHQWALYGEWRVVQFRCALHDVCSSSKLVSITVSINTSTKGTRGPKRKKEKA
jgi:hypothetical protein